MAVRPVWKGQLRFSLVSISGEMFTATDRMAMALKGNPEDLGDKRSSKGSRLRSACKKAA